MPQLDERVKWLELEMGDRLVQLERGMDKRIDWLERKMVEVLHGISIAFAVFAGWIIANLTMGQDHGLSWAGLFGVTCVLFFLFMRWWFFKGVPNRVRRL
jgi:hypothetical protein